MADPKMLKSNGDALQALQNATNGEAVSISGTSAQSSTAFTNKVVRLAAIGCDVAVRFGSNPTAVTTDMLLPDGAVEYFVVLEGDIVAGIAQDGASSGTLNVTEMA